LFVSFSVLNWPSCNSAHERWCHLWQIPLHATAVSFSSTLRLHVGHTSPSSLVLCTRPLPGVSSCACRLFLIICASLNFLLWCCSPTVQQNVMLLLDTCKVNFNIPNPVDARIFLANTFTIILSLALYMVCSFLSSFFIFPP